MHNLMMTEEFIRNMFNKHIPFLDISEIGCVLTDFVQNI
jgi:hypothetical protein